MNQPDCFSNGVPIRCFKCRTALDVGDWIMANVAPGAASGGTLMPFHRGCAPIVFHGPTFGPTPKEIRDAAIEECALLAECAAPNDGRDHAECPFCASAKDIRALKNAAPQVADTARSAPTERVQSPGVVPVEPLSQITPVDTPAVAAPFCVWCRMENGHAEWCDFR